MAVQIVAKLDTEDLNRYRQLTTKKDSYTIASDKYSANDIEQNEASFVRFMGEIAERYGLDDTRIWRISPYTGVVIYGDWE